jgi:hypothetical protein
MSVREIVVKWKGPYRQEETPEMEGAGLYQFYGWHNVFGPRSLLYIGQTENLPARIAKHEELWARWEWEVEVFVGEVIEPGKGPGDAVEEAEKLLIWWHSPPYNAQHVGGDEPAVEGHLRVVNLGVYARLHQVVQWDRHVEHDKEEWRYPPCAPSP